MSAAEENSPPLPADTTLQPPVRLSDSNLWQLQRNYYDQAGADAWETGIVPSFITTNAFLARQYAHLCLQFIRDFAAAPGSALVADEPIYIVELGSGHGKLGFLILRQLELLRSEYPTVRLEQLKYVMTDFTAVNVRYWETHSSLREYVASGQLDFATFDAENDERLRLSHSGVEISAQTVRNPIICIANYLFDSLKHDVFQCQSPQLREGLVELRGNVNDALDPTNPAILDRIVPKWTFRPLEPVSPSSSSSSATGSTFDCYPSEPAWNQVVQYYTDAGHDSTFLIPVGAFRCIQRFLHMSRSNLLVISGDKGYSHPEAFHSLDPPHLAVHGSFSFMVNYHAIEMLLSTLCPNTSVALNTTQHEGSLKITTLIACRNSSGTIESDFSSTIQTYRTRIDEFGPSDFFFMQQSVKDVPSPSIRHIVATLKLSCHDTDVFFRLSDSILEKIDEQIDLINLDIVGIMERVWCNYYRINLSNDVPFEMGRICFGLGMYKPALEHYANSHCVIGSNHVTYYNIGIVLYELGDFAAAERLLLKSLQLDTNYDRSLTWLAKTREELERRRQNALPLVELNPMVARTVAQAAELRNHIDTHLRRVLPNY